MNEEFVELEACQLAAIRCVFEYSKKSNLDTAIRADEIFHCKRYFEHEHNRIAELIRGKFPIDVHFHPDRIAIDGSSVIEGLLSTMTYENQYVSGISNGLLGTTVSGSRKRWESQLFGYAYDGQPASLRPKYGAINLFNSLDGACPRFGSCYLRLCSQVHRRCTLSYGDSHT